MEKALKLSKLDNLCVNEKLDIKLENDSYQLVANNCIRKARFVFVYPKF